MGNSDDGHPLQHLLPSAANAWLENWKDPDRQPHNQDRKPNPHQGKGHPSRQPVPNGPVNSIGGFKINAFGAFTIAKKQCKSHQRQS